MTLEGKLLGKTHRLYAKLKSEHGMYLSSYQMPELEVLLPNSSLNPGVKIGDILEVFLYRDSEDRLIATTTIPKVTLGEVGKLTVKDVTGIGAFLDWGLMKDLMLPFREMTKRVKVGDEVVVALYLDKSERLCATMKVYSYLKNGSPYTVGDHVTGTVYEITDSFGAFVAVEDQYSALIPRNEMNQTLEVGDVVHARIKAVTKEGKLTLSLGEKAYKQMSVDGEKILQRLKEEGGFLPFHDKTNAEMIKREFGMSKNAFKRAIGGLYKNGTIKLQDDGISLNG